MLVFVRNIGERFKLAISFSFFLHSSPFSSLFQPLNQPYKRPSILCSYHLREGEIKILDFLLKICPCSHCLPGYFGMVRGWKTFQGGTCVFFLFHGFKQEKIILKIQPKYIMSFSLNDIIDEVLGRWLLIFTLLY